MLSGTQVKEDPAHGSSGSVKLFTVYILLATDPDQVGKISLLGEALYSLAL